MSTFTSSTACHADTSITATGAAITTIATSFAPASRTTGDAAVIAFDAPVAFAAPIAFRAAISITVAQPTKPTFDFSLALTAATTIAAATASTSTTRLTRVTVDSGDDKRGHVGHLLC